MRKTKKQLIEELDELRKELRNTKAVIRKKLLSKEMLFEYFELFGGIFEPVPEAMVLIDKCGVILKMNDGAFDWLGYDPDEIIGRRIFDLPFIVKQSNETMRLNFEKCLDGECVYPYDIELITKSGETRIVHINAVFPDSGIETTPSFVVLLTDVTDMRYREEEREILTIQIEEELYRKTDELRKANANLERLVSEHTRTVKEVASLPKKIDYLPDVPDTEPDIVSDFTLLHIDHE